MSVLTDLIYGGSHAVAGLTEGAVNDAVAKYGADHPIAFPDTAYFFPTIYAATGVKVKTLGDLPACVGVLKSLITDQEDLGQALNAGLATAVGAEILEGLKFAEPKDAYEQAAVPGIGFVPDPIIRSLGVPLVTGDIPGVAVVLGKAENGEDVAKVVKDYQSKGLLTFLVGDVIEQCAEGGCCACACCGECCAAGEACGLLGGHNIAFRGRCFCEVTWCVHGVRLCFDHFLL